VVVHQPLVDEPARTMDVRQIEDFNLRPDTIFSHTRRKVPDQRGRVLVHDEASMHLFEATM